MGIKSKPYQTDFLGSAGVVAAAHPLAAEAGIDVLTQGGNAFDAAAACSAALNVVEPFMSGLAGMGVATCYVAREGRVRTLDFCPPVPRALPTGDLRGRLEEWSPSTIAPPGNLAGWAHLVGTYGKGTLAEALEPSIRLADLGFELTPFGAEQISLRIKELVQTESPGAAGIIRTYSDGTGDVNAGYRLRQQRLAATLTAIQSEGIDYLYSGPLGEELVDTVAKEGGWVTAEDLTLYRPRWGNPVTIRYGELEVSTLAPPSEAFQFLATLRIVEGAALSDTTHAESVGHLDAIFRAARLAAGLRIRYNLPSRHELNYLLGDEHMAHLWRRLRDGVPIEGPTERGSSWGSVPEQHTTSLSVSDSDGNVVCITQSLGSVFGSGIVLEDFGVCLNNFLRWGAVDSNSSIALRPGGPIARPMAPAIATRGGRPTLAIGSPGSYGIPQHQAQVFVRHIDFDQNIQAAIEAPRGRLTDGRALLLESRVPASVQRKLEGRGHVVEVGPAWTRSAGGVQAIVIDPASGLQYGGCDPRRDGAVRVV